MKFIALAILIWPAYATTVNISGTLGSGGSLPNATFTGSFDIDLGSLTTLQVLTTYDVVIDQGTSVEISSTDPNSEVEAFGNADAVNGALAIQFIEFTGPSVELLRLYFDLPFTGSGPILLETSTDRFSGGYDADGEQYTDLLNGTASTDAPEPGTCVLFGMGGFLLCWAARRKFKE